MAIASGSAHPHNADGARSRRRGDGHDGVLAPRRISGPGCAFWLRDAEDGLDPREGVSARHMGITGHVWLHA
jgi:hypothetical protein